MNISPRDLNNLITGIDAFLVVTERLLQASEMIQAGGDDGISAEDLDVLRQQAAENAQRLADRAAAMLAGPL